MMDSKAFKHFVRQLLLVALVVAGSNSLPLQFKITNTDIDQILKENCEVYNNSCCISDRRCMSTYGYSHESNLLICSVGSRNSLALIKINNSTLPSSIYDYECYLDINHEDAVQISILDIKILYDTNTKVECLDVGYHPTPIFTTIYPNHSLYNRRMQLDQCTLEFSIEPLNYTPGTYIIFSISDPCIVNGSFLCKFENGNGEAMNSLFDEIDNKYVTSYSSSDVNNKVYSAIKLAQGLRCEIYKPSASFDGIPEDTFFTTGYTDPLDIYISKNELIQKYGTSNLNCRCIGYIKSDVTAEFIINITVEESAYIWIDQEKAPSSYYANYMGTDIILNVEKGKVYFLRIDHTIIYTLKQEVKYKLDSILYETIPPAYIYYGQRLTSSPIKMANYVPNNIQADQIYEGFRYDYIRYTHCGDLNKINGAFPAQCQIYLADEMEQICEECVLNANNLGKTCECNEVSTLVAISNTCEKATSPISVSLFAVILN